MPDARTIILGPLPDSTTVVNTWHPSAVPSLDWLQSAVGGYIELVPGLKTTRPGVRVFCNDNRHGLRLNAVASLILGCELYGPVVVCGGFEERAWTS